MDLLFSLRKESGHSEALIVMPFPTSSQSRFRNSSIFISHTFCTSHLSISQLTLALLFRFSLSNGVWCCRRLRGDVLCVCVCLWWVVRAVQRRSGQAESNCWCCGAKVIRRAARSRWGKIEQASPVRSASTQSSCQPALFTCYTIIIRPQGTLWNNTAILWGTRRGHGEGMMVEYPSGRSLTESGCVLAAGSKLSIQSL